MTKLRITEIFYSLQGETRTVGLPTVFIRLTGCPLRCNYCDTTYSFQGGEWIAIDDILLQVENFKPKFVTVTGGEPLAQKSCHELLQKLCEKGYEVSLETSGALDVALVDPRVIKVIDIKTPGSGVVEKNNFNNFEYLSSQDQIKIVICDRADYDWAKKIINDYDLAKKCEVLFSPSYHQQRPSDLADWILQDRLPVRLQIQLHKFLWGEIPGR